MTPDRSETFVPASILFFIVLLVATPLTARLKPAPVDPAFPIEVTRYACSEPHGVGHDPKARVELTVELKNAGKEPIDLTAAEWAVQPTREMLGDPKSIWKTRFEYSTACATGGFPAKRLAPGKTLTLTVAWTPGRYGFFSLRARGTAESEWLRLAGMAVAYPPAKGFRPDTYFLTGMHAQDPETIGIAGRYGIKQFRVRFQPKRTDDGYDWSRWDPYVDACRKHHILAHGQLMVGFGGAIAPTIQGKVIRYRRNKPHIVWKWDLLGPIHEFGTFGHQVHAMIDRYKDVYTSGYVRNEPWEGAGISNWGASGKYLRAANHVARTAVKQVTPDFVLCGYDSRANFEDQAQVNGNAAWAIDAMTVHNYGHAFKDSTGPVQAAALGIPCWENENWASPADFFVVASCTMKVAAGLKKVAPLHTAYSMLTHANKTLVCPRPVGQVVSTWLHFVDGKEHAEELHKQCLPWIHLFKKPDSSDHVAVVFGHLKMYGGPYREGQGDVAFTQILPKTGVLQVQDPDKALTLFDLQGNPLASRKGEVLHVPLTRDPYYLHSAQGYDDLRTKLSQAKADYKAECVELALADFTAPLDTKDPVLQVQVANRALAPASGELTIAPPPGWDLKTSHKIAALRPGEVRNVTVPVQKAVPVAKNRYPFTLTWKGEKQPVTLKEELQVACFAQGSPAIDGDLSDWNDATFVTVVGEKTETSAVDRLLFQAKDQVFDDNALFVRFAGMWDNAGFSYAAKVYDPTESIRPSLQKGINHLMHAPPNDSAYWMAPIHPATSGDGLQIFFDIYDLGEKKDPFIPPPFQTKIDQRFFGLSADYEYDLYMAEENRLAKSYEEALQEALVRNAKKERRQRRFLLFKPEFERVGAPFAELTRLMAPGVRRHNAYPFSKKADFDISVLPGKQAVVKREGKYWIYECRIPWSELKEMTPKAGKTVRFGFAVRNNGRRAMEWARGRSIVGGKVQMAHPTWSCISKLNTRWGFVE